MLKRIESLIVTTENFADGVVFFKDNLELEMPSHGEKLARFEISGMPIFLAKSEKGNGFFISIETDDIEGDFKRLEERGVEFREAITTLEGGGRACFFAGPGNMEFMLYQPTNET